MKFSSKPVAEHLEVPLADEGRLEDIIDAWQDTRIDGLQIDDGGNISYVVCLATDGATNLDGKLREMMGLLATLGEQVCGHQTYRLYQTNPKTLLGSGKLEELADNARKAGANMLVIDAQLTPSQTRNIEMITGFAVCDREATILNVFLRHAQTKAARIQVEIAQLQYLKPRIRGIGLNMDQQAGGIGASRGAGETASQLLARRMDNRLNQLQKAADKVAKTGANQRKSRRGCKQAALVGYTNAGKTSIMNALTHAELSARNAPFETLDTTTRILSEQPGMQVLLSDTVGFIRQLPQTLLASFESTLAQTNDADLLVIVVDISDVECEMHLQTTLGVLSKLGTDGIDKFFVFNKTDRVEQQGLLERCQTLCGDAEHILVSAQDRDSMKQLHSRLIDKLCADQLTEKIYVRHDASSQLALIYASCQVLNTESDEQGTWYTIKAQQSVLQQLNKENK